MKLFRSIWYAIVSADAIEGTIAALQTAHITVDRQIGIIRELREQISEIELAAKATTLLTVRYGEMADSFVGKIKTLQSENEQLRVVIATATARIQDMLQDDDGQAFKEARKFIERTDPNA